MLFDLLKFFANSKRFVDRFGTEFRRIISESFFDVFLRSLFCFFDINLRIEIEYLRIDSSGKFIRCAAETIYEVESGEYQIHNLLINFVFRSIFSNSFCIKQCISDSFCLVKQTYRNCSKLITFEVKGNSVSNRFFNSVSNMFSFFTVSVVCYV